jgi:uroporphyrinogen III methyltransferase/synthase
MPGSSYRQEVFPGRDLHNRTQDEGRGDDNLNWNALAELNHTMVFYMGVANISEITRKLIENGRPSMTPAALVSRGTTPEQKTVLGTLSDTPKALENNVKPPALLVIGEVVNLSAVLNWFEQGEHTFG